MVRARCEWNHDDYSLNVANLPMAAPLPPAPILEERKKPKPQYVYTADLFGGEP
jgi:adenine-specific DNA-methyltransferase